MPSRTSCLHNKKKYFFLSPVLPTIFLDGLLSPIGSIQVELQGLVYEHFKN